MEQRAEQKRLEKLYHQLRDRLLDLSSRNPLISYKHRPTSKRQLRFVGAVLDQIYKRLLEQTASVQILPLPEPDDVPADERTPEFIGQLEYAKTSDTEYLTKLEALEADGGDAEFELAAAERALRDRVRAILKLEPRASLKAVNPSQHAQTLGINSSFDLTNAATCDNGSDRDLQTLKWPDALDALLEKISDEARLAEQELGLSTLFLVFGFLEWFESDASDKCHTAPLLLLPVRLEKRRSVGRKTIFTLLAAAEAPEINLSLKKRIERDFNRVLPDFEADEDSTGSAEAYLQATEEAIEGQKRWRVRRHLTLGHFAFGRLAMYAELDPDKWQHHPIKCELVKSVLAGTEVNGDGGASLLSAPEDYQIDDPEIERIAPYLIHDADASQHSALIDVAKRQNLVIQGPPGTGKSQTITNIIANVLGNGGTVLFVAEKQAALDVVKRRMDKAGLGEFCLELHSDRAASRRVIESLRLRHALGYGSRRQATTTAAPGPGWSEGRREVSTYLSALHRPISGGETAFSAIWKSVRATSNGELNLTRFADLKIPAAVVRDHTAHMQLQSEASVYSTMWQQYLDRYAAPASSPWAAIEIGQDVASGSAGSIVDDLTAQRNYAEQAAIALQACSEWGIETLDDVDECEGAVALFPADPPSQAMLDHLVGVDQFGARDLLQSLKELVALESNRQALPRLDSVTEHLLSAIKRTADIAATEGRNMESAAGLREDAELRSHTFSEVAECLKGSSSALDASGITGAACAERALALHMTTELLARIPPARRVWALTASEWRSGRFDGIFETWSRLAEREAAWRGRFSSFGDQAWPRHEDVRRVAALLAQNWFGRLTSKLSGHQQAIAAMAQHLCVSTISLPGAQDMEGFATHLLELKAFEANRTHRQMFGTLWCGLDTQFEAMQRDVAAMRSLLESVGALREGALVLEQVRKLDEASINMLVSERERLALLDRLAPAQRRIIGTHTIDEIFREKKKADDLLAKLAVADPERDVHHFQEPVKILQLAGQLEVRRRELNAHIQGHALARLVPILTLSPSELNSAERSLEWLTALAVKQLPGALIDILQKSAARLPEMRISLARGKTTAEHFRAGLADLANNHGLGSLVADDPVKAVQQLDGLLAAAHQLRDFLELRDQRRTLEGAGIGPIIRRAEEADLAPANLCELLDALVATGRAREARRTDRALTRASGLRLDAQRKAFIEQDRRKISHDRASIKSILRALTPPSGHRNGPKKTWTDMHLISNEFGKENRFVPVRSLVARAGRAMLTMKPCFMMSPLSLAKFLPPGSIEFDVLVIDEASQMRPEDALGALLRVKQIVVVGDQKQLPPTDFFARSGTTDASAKTASGDEDFEDVDDESILEVCQKTFNQSRMLRWHYRSRCESLIAFSNQRFYRNELITFPMARPGSFSVELRNVEGAYEARRNQPEAQQIVAEAIAHMHEYANCDEDSLPTIGIVAVNTEQRELIKEEFRLRASRDEAVERFCEKAKARGEEFFVKNLENVQGDERHVILISLTYGPKPGQQTPHQRFGPINGKHGHRRLNVLFSRARDRIVLFSSLTADQIVASPTSKEGVHVLKQYLEYAESGGQAVPEIRGGAPDSDFEIEVRDRLQRRGYVVDTQVGVSGYKIDLGVRNPDHPQTYLAGVECDGASYHSSKSARDRDRLRQDCLKEKGWDLVRVWSTDWFDDPESQTVKLVQHLEALRATAAERRAREDVPRTKADPPTDEVATSDKVVHADKSSKIDGSGTAVEPTTNHRPVTARFAPPHLPTAPATLEKGDRGLDAAQIESNRPISALSSGLEGLDPNRVSAMEEFQYAVATVSDCGVGPNPNLFYEPTYVSALRQMVEHVIEVEGPLYEDVLVKRIARAHGFQRNGDQIVDRVLGAVAPHFPKTEEDGTVVLWPDGANVRELISFRIGGDRDHSDIPLPELASLADRFLGAGHDQGTALQMMKEFFGLSRLREATRKRFEAAVALAAKSAA